MVWMWPFPTVPFYVLRIQHLHWSIAPLFRKSAVIEHLRTFREKKALGWDSVGIRKVKQIDKTVPRLIQTIMNKCLEIEAFPTCWKKTEIVFLLKKSKNSKQAVQYKPVILLPVFSEVHEKLVKNTLVYNLGSNKLMSSKKYSFRKGSSAEQQVQYLLFYVRRKCSDKYTARVAFDIMREF